jgi:hypothetical protein
MRVQGTITASETVNGHEHLIGSFSGGNMSMSAFEPVTGAIVPAVSGGLAIGGESSGEQQSASIHSPLVDWPTLDSAPPKPDPRGVLSPKIHDLNRSPEAPDRSPQCRRCTRRQAKRSYSIKRPGPLRLRRSTTRTLLLQPRPWHHYASCSPARSKPASQLKISVLAMRPHRHYRTQAFLLGTTRIPLLDAIRSTLTQRLKWPYRLIFRKVSLTPHKLTMMTRGFFIGEVPWRESLRILYPSGSVRNRKRRGCTTREWRDMAAGPIGAVAHLTAILPILKSTFRCTIPPSTPSNGKDASLKGGRS